MPASESLLVTGRFVRTDLDEAHPDASPRAMLVERGRIVAIGAPDEVRAPVGAKTLDLGEGWVLPGIIEPHGHPSEAALQLSDAVVDIRPVVVERAEEVWARIEAALAEKPGFVLANGWDPLLQRGLEAPTIERLDALAGDTPWSS